MEKSSQKPNSYISLQKKLIHYLVMKPKKIRCHREQLYTPKVEILIQNTISKFSKTKNQTKKRPPKVPEN